jgi:zinc transporter, ZIP family
LDVALLERLEGDDSSRKYGCEPLPHASIFADVKILWVSVAALVTALATGLGALPFLAVRRPSVRWLGVSNAVAAGFMLSAAGALLVEGGLKGVGRVALGAAAGALTVTVARRIIGAREDLSVGAMRGADARKAILIVAVMTVHSFSEGIGVGVSYGGGDRLGVLITAAIAIHNIPEGLAISLVLVPRGASIPAAAFWSVFSSLPQPLMAAPAYLFVETFRSYLPVGLGFAAGAMAWLVFAELVPDARAELDRRTFALALGVSLLAMSALQAVFLAS